MSIDLLKERYDNIKQDVIKLTGKSNNYDMKDLEKVMESRFGAFKIDLKDINCIMKKKYKLYHKNSNTPRVVSEEVISDEKYMGTYVIYCDDLKDKKSVYVHRAFMISSEDGVLPDRFAEFNLTYDISMYLEILCNHTLDSILERLK